MQILSNGELLGPDVYEISERTKEWAYGKLGLDDEDSQLSYIVEPVSDEHQIVYCQVDA